MRYFYLFILSKRSFEIMSSLGSFVGGCFVLLVGCTLSSSAGVGGGGINVPIFQLVFGYSFQESVILSSFTILGNYLSQSFVNIRKHHPYCSKRPLIYVEIVLILLPCQLGGSNLGSLINIIIPQSILYLIALVVLVYAFGMTFHKGVTMWQKELKMFLKEHKEFE